MDSELLLLWEKQAEQSNPINLQPYYVQQVGFNLTHVSGVCALQISLKQIQRVAFVSKRRNYSIGVSF